MQIALQAYPVPFRIFWQIFEDVARHRADRHANSSLTRAWDRKEGEFKHIAWKDVSPQR